MMAVSARSALRGFDADDPGDAEAVGEHAVERGEGCRGQRDQDGGSAAELDVGGRGDGHVVHLSVEGCCDESPGVRAPCLIEAAGGFARSMVL